MVPHAVVDELGLDAVHLAGAAHGVKSGGVLVIGTFGPGGPQQCSGLPVARHDVASLLAHFNADFDMLSSEVEIHRTPWGQEQQFTWVSLHRK